MCGGEACADVVRRKDSALALHRAHSLGFQVERLINFYDVATGRVRFHATRIEMLRQQAAVAGIDLQAIATTWPEMVEHLVDALANLRMEGYVGVVFGDIHLADVRAWYERRVMAAGLKHVEPLWGESPADLVQEFVGSGGRAVITCVDSSQLDSSWVGRIIDDHFVDEILSVGVDPSGENGEYHSFAFASPMFREPVAWRPGDVRSDSRFSQLDVVED